MAIVKGFYNTINGVFLGNMVAVNEATSVMSTPRYVEGVCYGEYDTDTDTFIPLTNPVIIPKGTIVEQDDSFTDSGQIITEVRGYQEDKGSGLAKKGSVAGFTMKPSNVETRDVNGESIDDTKIFKFRRETPVQDKSPSKSTKPKIREARPTKIDKKNLPVIDWDKLFK